MSHRLPPPVAAGDIQKGAPPAALRGDRKHTEGHCDTSDDEGTKSTFRTGAERKANNAAISAASSAAAPRKEASFASKAASSYIS